MKHITLIIIAMLLSVAAIAQQTYDTDFTQVKLMKVSGKTTDKAGHITFDGNDQLTMTYTQPEGEYFIIEGNMVKINMDGKKAELDAEKVKMLIQGAVATDNETARYNGWEYLKRYYSTERSYGIMKGLL